ncbi:hypothetical protein GPJ56_009155 [Histomonas meleagridis]|uniref:uncharacterized protein n=1 Tax=Histomonas meleagridis TaxID=135588 RepID=UPI003559D212|nr:hypothetical protein GPJ56_009155 [Histomonas meleagridis]KAH0799091.1 hypothetical protein GO595_007888 [Histomonas meleagridis]
MIPVQDPMSKRNKRGKKEKDIVIERMVLYGEYLPEVMDAFLSHNLKEAKFMRHIQKAVCQKFNISTDRAAWRTKAGMKGWFCMHWPSIKEFVRDFVGELGKQEDIVALRSKKNRNNKFSIHTYDAPWINELRKNEKTTLPPISTLLGADMFSFGLTNNNFEQDNRNSYIFHPISTGSFDDLPLINSLRHNHVHKI